MAEDYTLGELYRRQADHERRTEAELAELRRQIQMQGATFVSAQVHATERAGDARSVEALHNQLNRVESEAKERHRGLAENVGGQEKERRRLWQTVVAAFIAPVVVGLVLYLMIGR